MKLNQIIAIENNIKSKGSNTLTSVYHSAQKSSLFDGLVREYKPLTDDGEKFPSEKKLVQMRANDVLAQVRQDVGEWFQVEFEKDLGNTSAFADVKVDNEVLLAAAPSTYLLFLEKKLIDVRTFVEALPVLDPAEDWTWDSNTNYFKSALSQTAKTKKVQKALVLLEPTDKHPGQAVQITDDQVVGYWNQVKLSGALQQSQKDKFLSRLEALTKAVKVAREEANNTQVDTNKNTKSLLDWVFNP